ncbi:MAG TPA: HIT family protein [Anaerolineales bacterium]|nr:HIT family protein [Anaerolineales bacterium]
MSNCIFCDILEGKKPAEFVYRDEVCVAFMDIRPINPGHVLVIPQKHAVLLTELDTESVKHMLWVAQRVDAALRLSGVQCEAVNLFLADGRAAGQEVMHVHLHVIPRYQGDGHHLRFSSAYFSPTSNSELKRTAELIRKQIEVKP